MKAVPVKPVIKFSDLDKVDVRVGRILAVEDIENSDKLVRLTVDFGEFKGEISEGMLFDIEYADGIMPVLAVPEMEVPNGARAG